MSFTLDDAIEIANQAVFSQDDRHLTDLEIAVLQGVWAKLDYDQIAIQTNYATSYISQDIAPNLWKLLSAALGERIRKTNLKSALQRYAETVNQPPQPLVSALVPAKAIAPSHSKSIASESVSPITKDVTNSGDWPRQSPKDRLPCTQVTTAPQPDIPEFDTAATIQTPKNYIERSSIESICYEALLQPGALVRLKAPRLMGKTSLIMKVLSEIVQADYRAVRLSLAMADRSCHFQDLNRFLRWFCLNISRELGIPSLLQEYWEEEELGAKVSCTAYFEDYLLTQSQHPIVLCLDDVDILFSHSEICEDFFGLLRSWYEKARTRPLWMQLRLVIIHATDAYTRLHWNQSPFNVGLPLELPEFNLAQIQQLATHYRIRLERDNLVELMELVGGHPALLGQAFSQLNANPHMSLSKLLAEATTESSLFGHHLREHLQRLQQAPDLAQAFQKVVANDQPISLAPLAAYQLQGMGLIKLSGNQATLRCQLYRHYFRDRLSL